jgi:hypothetical protein
MPSRARSSHGSGDESLDAIEVCDAAESDLHEPDPNACIFESELLDGLLVAGIAERSGHDTSTRHDRMDLPKRAERDGTECAVQRILRVNHIGATIYGAASLCGIRNTDQ